MQFNRDTLSLPWRIELIGVTINDNKFKDEFHILDSRSQFICCTENLHIAEAITTAVNGAYDV